MQCIWVRNNVESVFGRRVSLNFGQFGQRGHETVERETDPIVKHSQQILLMVHELHKLGYQRLRIAPGMSSSGMHWRCSVTHVGNISTSHGAILCEFDREAAHYTTGQGNEYFGWEDSRKDTARQLAAKFIDRFPTIAGLGQGVDWQYVGWFVQMLGLSEHSVLPVAYADWHTEPDPRWLPTTTGFDSGLPMPPAGERAERRLTNPIDGVHTHDDSKASPMKAVGPNKILPRMALSIGILRFCDRKLPRPRSVEERDPSRS
jgi:hypothetical protein